MGRQEGELRAPALERFMTELRALRTEAGEPSFRRMASKSGAVSHATLHLTVTGYRLQPWETVREFVRACDGDERDWQLRWERVRLALAEKPAEAAAAPLPPELSLAGTVEARPAVHPVAARRRWYSPRVLVPLALGLVIGGVVGVVLVGGESPAPAGDPAPVVAAPAVVEGPVYPGDASQFVADVTIPDNMVVTSGSQFVKVWRIKNSGSVEWRNRFLRRTDAYADPAGCRTPPRIPVNDTAPQQQVQVTVTVNAPAGVTDCKVFWKMVDENDRELLPANRPLFFAVKVRP